MSHPEHLPSTFSFLPVPLHHPKGMWLESRLRCSSRAFFNPSPVGLLQRDSLLPLIPRINKQDLRAWLLDYNTLNVGLGINADSIR